MHTNIFYWEGEMSKLSIRDRNIILFFVMASLLGFIAWNIGLVLESSIVMMLSGGIIGGCMIQIVIFVWRWAK